MGAEVTLSITQIMSGLVAVGAAFVAILSRFDKQRTEQVKSEIKALWRRIDESNGCLTQLRDDLHSKYYDRDETDKTIQSTFSLLNQRLDTVTKLLEDNRVYMESLMKAIVG